ncbi:unnamed protein product [Vitrella brassicaformis CCMP3155]|uniref:Uncharacterized protein n=2 Tax=Vitrella brassicaformis TaxID=1169539 RepID=A0A0G4ESY8_VITBC|nr:unnamed protein product [Vitrella brassicaformis CCMP3155]|eukprot:CEM00995.1 unnamed protein product [Vitrella brassicaformis CCMP3155]
MAASGSGLALKMGVMYLLLVGDAIINTIFEHEWNDHTHLTALICTQVSVRLLLLVWFLVLLAPTFLLRWGLTLVALRDFMPLCVTWAASIVLTLAFRIPRMQGYGMDYFLDGWTYRIFLVLHTFASVGLYVVCLWSCMRLARPHYYLPHLWNKQGKRGGQSR